MRDLSDLWTSMTHSLSNNFRSSVLSMGSLLLMVVPDQVICCQLCLGLDSLMSGHADMADPVGHNGPVPTNKNIRWGVVDLLMLKCLRGQKLLGRHV
jgi:hypothetical protein